MAERLLLVNPVKKGANSGRKKSRRSGRAQSTRKRGSNMAAKRKTPRRNAKGQFVKGGGGRRASTRKRTSAPKRRTRRNPTQRKARAYRATPRATTRRNPTRRRRTRRNPVRRNRFTVNRIMSDMVQPAFTGAVGAVANDMMFAYLPLPEQFKAPGMMRYAAKGVSAVAMSWLAGFVVNQRTANQVGVGALTCLTSEVVRNVVAQTFPGAAMDGMGLYVNGMGYYNPALPAGGMDGMGLYVGGQQSASLPPASDGMGMYGQEKMAENGYSYY